MAYNMSGSGDWRGQNAAIGAASAPTMYSGMFNQVSGYQPSSQTQMGWQQGLQQMYGQAQQMYSQNGGNLAAIAQQLGSGVLQNLGAQVLGYYNGMSPDQKSSAKNAVSKITGSLGTVQSHMKKSSAKKKAR